MKRNFKRVVTTIVSMVMCLSMFDVMPEFTGKMNVITAEASGMTIDQLRQKFPAGKYWNHAGNPGSSNSVNNQDGYTSTPCPKHGTVGTSKQTCNGFCPGSTQLSWQCMGFAEKLGYDVTGFNPRNNSNGWFTSTSSSALDTLKAGDIVRYKNNNHSIYVLGVNGDTVTYADCNSDGHCIIRWDQTISKSTLRSSFTHVRSAPSSLPPSPSSQSPKGVVDGSVGGAGTVSVSGWGFDPDNTGAAIDVHVYLRDGAGNMIGLGITKADKERTDVNAVHGCGNNHGYSAAFETNLTGDYHVLVALIDTGSDDAVWCDGSDITITKPLASPNGEIVNLGDNFDASIKSVQSSKYIITNTSSSNVFLYENPVGYSERYWNFARQSDGSYRIKAYCNDKYMDVAGAIDEDGGNVQSWPDNGGGSAQKWFIHKCGNNYVLRPACSNARVLDVYGAETKDGANLAISEYHGGANQQVIIEKTLRANAVNLGDNFDAMIKNTESGKFVTVSSNHDVVLYDASGDSYASKRIWNFARQSDGSYKITSYYNSKCLDVNNFTDANGTNIATYQSNNSSAQRWYIVKNGNNYRLMPACSNTRSLDIAGGSTDTNGANIQIWDNNDLTVQRFSINKISDTTKPTVSKIEILNVTENGYKVKVTASDNVGIKQVKVPTWTSEGGQDDLVWHVAAQTSQNTWEYNVKISEHLNRRGIYYTDVYAYDFSGNEAKCSGSTNQRSTVKVGLYDLTINPNGGTMKDESGKNTTNAVKITKNQLIYNGSNYCSLTWTIPTRTGYTFTGFYTAATGGTKVYNADGKCVNEGKYFKDNNYMVAGDLTVYAQWEKDESTAVIQPVTTVVTTQKPVATVDTNTKEIVGDVNSDGVVNVADLVLVKKYLVNKVTVTKELASRIDMNGDGKVNVFDTVILRRKLLSVNKK